MLPDTHGSYVDLLAQLFNGHTPIFLQEYYDVLPRWILVNFYNHFLLIA